MPQRVSSSYAVRVVVLRSNAYLYSELPTYMLVENRAPTMGANLGGNACSQLALPLLWVVGAVVGVVCALHVVPICSTVQACGLQLNVGQIVL